MPPLGIIPAGELPDGELVQEKVDEDLDEQKARLKCELYDKSRRSSTRGTTWRK